MNITLPIAISLLVSIGASFASAGQDRGGGDLCESRIQTIRDDLKSWIAHGGAKGLQLPQNTSATQYSTKMLKALHTAKIRCVGPWDSGYPVQVDGTAKECRFNLGPKGSLITCDRQKLSDRSESDQYVLIHHEYAGVAGLEKPAGDQSTYAISKQISSYLVATTEMRLAVKAPSQINLEVGHLVPADYSIPTALGRSIVVSQQSYGRTISGRLKYGDNYISWYAVIDSAMKYGPSVYLAKGKVQAVYDVGSATSTQTVCEYAVNITLTEGSEKGRFSVSYQIPEEIKLNVNPDGSCPLVKTTRGTDNDYIWAP